MALKFYESPFHVTETAEVASNMVLRADIIIMIRDIIQHQGWTQQQAANQLCISQPRISDIMNGKIEKFTLDFLVTILDALGFKAHFTFGDINSANIDIRRVKNKSA
ncbi:Cro/Cl family transcriptional regulator [Methyloprofundus sedimenti]|uniref:Cro/Cl family transcriptional regulator n=1 Tax=Methyloprofundus sedimenti TaxID=1420851 RepID=A0A1V8M4V7_9GAMM|nr:XRE family transcriptional regulator [Methyloprofundus sedimenti]OQK16516.1 Cro/Cl family transcriptional regulator [Methyloprofundus sedimenti]